MFEIMDAVTISTIIGAALALLSAIGGIIAFAVKVGQFTEKFKNIETSYSDLATTVTKLSEKMIKVESILMLKYKNASDVLTAKNSPRMLTSIGETVYKDMKGQEFLNTYKELLFSKISNEHPDTAWDVENASMNVLISLLDDDIINDIKVFVYNYPMVKKEDGTELEISLQDALLVLSLPLRDMYLDAHPNILR